MFSLSSSSLQKKKTHWLNVFPIKTRLHNKYIFNVIMQATENSHIKRGQFLLTYHHKY